MTYFSEYIQWNFYGGISGLIAFSLLMVLLITVSYKYALKEISLRGKILLSLLRCLTVALLIFCLCGPAVIKEKTEVNKEKPSAAIIIDESGSMREKGYNNRSRLDEAGIFVKRLSERSADRCNIKLYGFAETLRQVKAFEELKNSGNLKSSTALFKNIFAWTVTMRSENIKAILCITDGIETADGNKNEALAALSYSSIPQIFIPSTLKLPFQPALEFMQLECPGTARPGAMFPVKAIIRKNGQLADGKIIFTVRNAEKEIYKEELEAKGSGPIHYPVKFNMAISEEGTHVFEGEIKSRNMKTTKIFWTVATSKAVDQKILLYQGRLTLDQAYLRRVFSEDKRAELITRFAKDVLGNNNPANPKIGTGFPDYEELSKYNVVILNAISKTQITKQMETDLKKYLNNGGALLFMIVNNPVAKEFSSSRLEELLPVTFEDIDKSSGYDSDTLSFIKKMRAYRKGMVGKNAKGESIIPPLTPFEITEDGKLNRIFTVTDIKDGKTRSLQPMFQDFALVKDIKPGATLLAETNTYKKDGKGRPLLAIQNYGRGRSAVMCSDGLWRWKLSIPSFDNSYEIFWQNLLLWLSAGNSGKSAWSLNSCIFPAGKPAALSFKTPPGMKADDLKFEVEKKGTGVKIPLLMSIDEEKTFRGEFTGEADAAYMLRALKGKEIMAESIINFRKSESKSELENLSPDIRTLTELARASGYELVNNEKDIDWDKLLPAVETQKTSSVKIPLWHKPWIFLLLLGLLLSELIIRRAFRLV